MKQKKKNAHNCSFKVINSWEVGTKCLFILSNLQRRFKIYFFSFLSQAY